MIEQILDRYSDKIYFHPRTGEKIVGATAGDRVHDMPALSKTHLNGCPRTAYHRMVNQPRGTKGEGKPTGQLKTIWGDAKHGYVSKHKHDLQGGPRFVGDALPIAPPQRRMTIPNRY